MQGQFLCPAGMETIGARIGPDIGASAAVITEAEAIKMCGIADLEDEDQFVLAAENEALTG